MSDQYNIKGGELSDEQMEYLRKLSERGQAAASALESVRDAIQQAEEFGLVRTESGEVITGAVMTEHGIMLTKD